MPTRRITRPAAPLVVLVCLLTLPVRAQSPRQSPPPAVAPPSRSDTAQVTDTTRAGAPVVVGRDTVLFVPTRLGAFSAEDRANAIAARLRAIAHQAVDSIQIQVSETSSDLVAGETILMTVTDADAAAVGRTRGALAAESAAALLAELRKVSLAQTLKEISAGGVRLLLLTAVFVGLLLLVQRGSQPVANAIESRRSRMPVIRIQRFEILSAAQLSDLLVGAIRLVRIVVLVVLAYFYVVIGLRFFPWTRPLSGRILGYVTAPLGLMADGFVAYLPNIFFIAAIVLVTRYALKAIHLAFIAIERGHIAPTGFDRDWAEPTYNIVRFLVLAFAAIVLFPYLPGAKSDAFKGVTLFLGVLFSLGSSSAISNIVAGVVLTYTRAFRIGDRITMGETTGDVVGRTLLVTRVRTIKNVDITVPNAMVLNSHIQNFSAVARVDGLILHTSVTIGYDAPWSRVHELLIAAARATPGIEAKPEPFVLQRSLDDFFVNYEINAYTRDPAVMARTYSLLHANIQDRFNEAGVEIMSPHYAALRDGNHVTIPGAAAPRRG